MTQTPNLEAVRKRSPHQMKGEVTLVNQSQKGREGKGNRSERREGKNACVRAAETILESLPPKFSPTSSKLNNDRLSLTPQHIKKNEEERKKENRIITFNPSIQMTPKLEDCFRVFTDPEAKSLLPATRPMNKEI